MLLHKKEQKMFVVCFAARKSATIHQDLKMGSNDDTKVIQQRWRKKNLGYIRCFRQERKQRHR
jgi:hypothetical protein